MKKQHHIPKKQPVQAEAVSNCRIALEPRVLLDAALLATVADEVADGIATADDLAPALGAGSHSDHSDVLAMLDGYSVPAAAPSTVVIIDASVEDDARAAIQLPVGAQVVELNAQQDGIEQVSAILADQQALDALHIVSHGAQAQLQLGSTLLDSDTLQSRSSEISAWSSAFAADGDILLYGCDVADSPAGEAFVTQLAQLTSADVAASDDATGSAERGGDLQLEVQVGDVADTRVLSAEGDFLLPTVPVNNDPYQDGGIQFPSFVAGTTTHFTVPTDTFVDPDGDPLTYGAAEYLGYDYDADEPILGPLPDWLSFDSATRTFSGDPATAQHGPVSYAGFADSPFYQDYSDSVFSWFHLENFEDGLFDVPGVVVLNNNPGGGPVGVVGPAVYTDSVDEDSGPIDGQGADGHSMGSLLNDGGEAFGFTFEFDADELGQLPTHAGIVWTDGGPGAAPEFEAFDANGQSLGVIGGVPVGDASFAGETAEDHFYGVRHSYGISKFVIRNPSGINSLEVDHLQYGYQYTPATEYLSIGVGVEDGRGGETGAVFSMPVAYPSILRDDSYEALNTGELITGGHNLFLNSTFHEWFGSSRVSTDAHWNFSDVDGAGVHAINGFGAYSVGVLHGDGSVATDPTMSQTVYGLVPGETYRISGDLVPYDLFNDSSEANFGISVDGNSIYTESWVPDAGWGQYQEYAFSTTFEATASSHTFGFSAEMFGDSTSLFIDNLQLTSLWPGLLDNDILFLDADISPSVSVIDDVDHGTLQLEATGGDFTYTPTAGFTGTDSFTYTVATSYSSAGSSTHFIPVDPTETYLRTVGDLASDAQPVDLAALGVSPGDHLWLQTRNGYITDGESYNYSSSLSGVFSSTPVLLGGTELNRVPGALDAGDDINTPFALMDGVNGNTDIPEDFVISELYTNGVHVQVPQGAQYLFLSPIDDFFANNSSTGYSLSSGYSSSASMYQFGLEIHQISTATVSINVGGTNTEPTLSLSNPLASVTESSVPRADIRVADIQVFDDGAGTNTLSLSGADASHFLINNNQLFLRGDSLLDFEVQNKLDVIVEVDDPSVGSTPDDGVPFSLAITDVNEVPTLSLLNQQITLPEQGPLVSPLRVATIDVDDDALGSETLQLGGADAGLFEIINDGLFLRQGTLLDYETQSSLSVTVSVDDPTLGSGADDVQTLTIAVQNVNEPASLALLNTVNSLPEQPALLAPFKVADIQVNDDGTGTLQTSLSGPDAGLFEISGSELFLRAGTVLDFETAQQLEVTVAVDDAAVLPAPDDQQTLLINITDINEPPSVSLLGPLTSIPEQGPLVSPLRIATIDVQDDALGGETLQLGGADAGLFEIINDGLFLRQGTLLDYETQSSLTVTVSVDDPSLGSGDEDAETLTLAVQNVNEPATLSLLNTVTTLPEQSLPLAAALKVADIQTDDDGTGNPQLALSGDDAALFEIVGNALFLRAGSVLDFETNPQLEVDVVLDDASLQPSPDDQQTLVIQLSDVYEPPVVVDDHYATTASTPISTGFGAGFGTGQGDLVNGLGGSAGFGEGVLGSNDDSSSGAIDLTPVFEGGLNFFGSVFESFYVNNNGNITFDTRLSTFTPFALTGSTANPIIAPFFADVDTRGGPVAVPTPGGNSMGTNLVYWDLDPSGGRYGEGVVTVTWDDVGHYSSNIQRLNAFQIRLHDRGAGDADIEFRYESINWTTGNASGGSNGLGGTVARAGYSAANGTDFYEFPQSGVQSGMLDLPNQVGSTTVNATAGAVGSGLLLNDLSPDANVLNVETVNGDPAAVGNSLTLPSGARLTVAPDGSFVYDPNGAFDALLPGQQATDSFTYTAVDLGAPAGDTSGPFEATANILIAGVNDPPEVAPQQFAARIASSVQGEVFGQVLASDVDPGTVLQFTLDPNGAITPFDIDPVTGDIFLADTTLTGNVGDIVDVDILVSDGDLVTAERMSVELLAANFPPQLQLSNSVSGVDEGVVPLAGLKVADIQIVDDGAGANQLSLAGADSHLFQIVGAELHLIGGTVLDYETQSSLYVSISVDDPVLGSSVEDTVSLSLPVNNINEPASLLLSNVLSQVNEHDSPLPGPLKVADIQVDDDGTGSPLVSLAGRDAALFEVSGGALYIRAGTQLDFEALPQLYVDVVVDDATLSPSPDDQQSLVIDVVDINDAPIISLLNPATIVPEQPALSAPLLVANIDVHDDALGSYTLQLGGADAGLFEIVGLELFLRQGTVLDFETQSSLDVSVSVDDPSLGTGAEDSASLNIAIHNINEPASLQLSNVLTQVNEQTSPLLSPLKVADIQVSDDGTGSPALSLSGTDAALFEISANALFIRAGTQLNFESQPQLQVDVIVDDATLSPSPDDQQSLLIDVLDINEAPALSLLNAVSVVPEQPALSAPLLVANIDVHDDALGSNSLQLGGADAGLFEIVGLELFLRQGTVLDFETQSSLDVSVSVDDPSLGTGAEDSASLSIAIHNINEPASLQLSNVVTQVNEQTSPLLSPLKVADIQVSDDGTGSPALSLSGTDAALFEISANALFIRAGTQLNFESQPQLQVDVIVDDATLSPSPDDQQSLLIDVLDINESPLVALQNISVTTLPEQLDPLSSSLRVADIVVTDDGLGSNDLSLSGQHADMFEIVADGLFLRQGSVLDFETDSSLEVIVSVDDTNLGATPESSASLSIEITDVDFVPDGLGLGGTQVSESAANGSVVGDLNGGDPEGELTSFSIQADTSGGAFGLNDAGDQLIVVDSRLLDASLAASHQVTVRLSDPAGNAVTDIFTITVQAGGQDNTFTNALNDGDMFNPLNWSLGFVPGGTDSITLPPGSGSVDVPDGFTAASLTNSGGTLVFSGDVNIGTYTQTGGSLHFAGGNFVGDLQIDGGTLTGSGQVNGETRIFDGLAPGSSPGQFGFVDLTLDSSSTTVIELGSNYDQDLVSYEAGEDFDHFTVTNQAQLAGTLQLEALAGWNPVLGESFVIVQGGSLSGGFAQIFLPDLSADGLRVEVIQNATQLIARVVSASEPVIPSKPVTPVETPSAADLPKVEEADDESAILEVIEESKEGEELEEQLLEGEEEEGEKELVEEEAESEPLLADETLDPQALLDQLNNLPATAAGEAEGVAAGDGDGNGGLSGALRDQAMLFEQQRQQSINILDKAADLLNCGS